MLCIYDAATQCAIDTSMIYSDVEFRWSRRTSEKSNCRQHSGSHPCFLSPNIASEPRLIFGDGSEGIFLIIGSLLHPELCHCFVSFLLCISSFRLSFMAIPPPKWPTCIVSRAALNSTHSPLNAVIGIYFWRGPKKFWGLRARAAECVI